MALKVLRLDVCPPESKGADTPRVCTPAWESELSVFGNRAVTVVSRGGTEPGLGLAAVLAHLLPRWLCPCHTPWSGSPQPLSPAAQGRCAGAQCPANAEQVHEGAKLGHSLLQISHHHSHYISELSNKPVAAFEPQVNLDGAEDVQRHPTMLTVKGLKCDLCTPARRAGGLVSTGDSWKVRGRPRSLTVNLSLQNVHCSRWSSNFLTRKAGCS